MSDYVVHLSIPVTAVDPAAARAAQLDVFRQVQLALSWGVYEKDYQVRPLPDERFAQLSRVAPREAGEL